MRKTISIVVFFVFSGCISIVEYSRERRIQGPLFGLGQTPRETTMPVKKFLYSPEYAVIIKGCAFSCFSRRGLECCKNPVVLLQNGFLDATLQHVLHLDAKSAVVLAQIESPDAALQHFLHLDAKKML